MPGRWTPLAQRAYPDSHAGKATGPPAEGGRARGSDAEVSSAGDRPSELVEQRELQPVPVPGTDQNRQTALAIQSSEAFVSAISNPWYSAFTVK